MNLTGGGNIRLGILGSINPYRQKLGGLNVGGGDSTTSTDGLEFSLSKGARIFFGGEEETTKYQANNDLIVVETGSLKLSAPTTVDNEESGGTSEHIHTELVIARLVGGVRVGISVGFMVKHPDSTDNDLIEVLPWRNHTDIVLRTPEAVKGYKGSPIRRRTTTVSGKKTEVWNKRLIIGL